METEIWPNATRLARARGIRMVLANGRISDRSFPRYRAFRRLLRPVLSRYERILAREDEDRQRFIAIGAPEEVVEEEQEKREEALGRKTKIAEALERLKDAG